MGHCSIAPSRKVDVGSLYPWRALFEEYGVGYYPSLNMDNEKEAFERSLAIQEFLEDQDVIELLKIYGFRGKDEDILSAFRLRFYYDPENHDKLSKLAWLMGYELDAPSYSKNCRTPQLSLREKIVILGLMIGYYNYKDDFLGFDEEFRTQLKDFSKKIEKKCGIKII